MIGQKTKRDVELAAVLLLLVAACAGVLADDITHQVREPGAHCCLFFRRSPLETICVYMCERRQPDASFKGHRGVLCVSCHAIPFATCVCLARLSSVGIQRDVLT